MVVVIANLKPRNMRGIKSAGVIERSVSHMRCSESLVANDGRGSQVSASQTLSTAAVRISQLPLFACSNFDFSDHTSWLPLPLLLQL
jgi:hypothetical protein